MNQSMVNPILSLKNISKKYKNGKEELLVLNGLNLDIFESDFVSIMGKSGSGKTTLLNIIALLDQNYAGEIFYENKPIADLTTKQLFKLRTRNIGYVFQNHNLIDELNVLQNVEMPMGYLGYSKNDRRRIALKYLKEVKLEGKENLKVHELSGGEQQRASIARALSFSPKLLIADEPTGNLDATTSNTIISLMQELNNKLKTTIVLVTHDGDLSHMCKRSTYLLGGKLYDEK